jgi:opacity protein-like surface antigen
MLNTTKKTALTGIAGIAAWALAGLATPALAQDASSPFDGPYVGVAIGLNNFDYKTQTQSAEDSGLAYEGLLGFRRSTESGFVAGVEAHLASSRAKEHVALDIGGGETYDGNTALGRSFGFDGIFGKTFGASQQFLGFLSAGYLNQRITACCQVEPAPGDMLNITSLNNNESGYRVGAGFEAKVFQNLAWRATVHYSDTGHVDQTQLMTGFTAGF